MKLVILLIWLGVSLNLKASIFGEETAILLQLVAQTAQEINELEKLVSNTEKYTKKIRQYNELIEDHWLRAERIKFLAEDIASRKDIKNLRGLNYTIRELKLSMSDLRSRLLEYDKIDQDSAIRKSIIKVQDKNARKLEYIAKSQVRRSIGTKTNSGANKVTSENTALIYEEQLRMHKTQRQLLKEMSVTNSLLSREAKERESKEMKKRKMYGEKK